MDQKFLAAIQNIGNANQNDVVAKVTEMFSKISSMGMQEITATHQTFWFFYQNMRNLTKEQEYFLDKTEKAIFSRMIALCGEPADRSERARRVEVLGEVCGGDIYYQVLGHAIDGHQPS